MKLALREWPRHVSSSSSSTRDKVKASSLRLHLVLVVVLSLCTMSNLLPSSVFRSLQKQSDDVAHYNQASIIRTAPYFSKFVPKLLAFDGNEFQVFGLAHKDTEYFDSMRYTYRYIDTIPLLVHALMKNFPDRFQPGSPPFELLFTDADSPHSDCVNKQCPVNKFSPILLFGSVPRDGSVFPTMKSFPHPVYSHCLYHYHVHGVQKCEWPQEVDPDIPWEDLKDTIVWRGSDFPFLHYHDRFHFHGSEFIMHRRETSATWKNGTKDAILDDLTTSLYQHFGPRWRAALLSVRAEQEEGGEREPWIDSRFVSGGENTEIRAYLASRGINITGDRIDSKELSKYKYQIDFGGGGGTTWEGTLTKLLMPGVLFHHETETKDWYFDLAIPWKHYVPIKWDLSNLRSAYLVAQSNQERMKRISAEGTKLAEYILSTEYMDQVYDELFVEYLGKVVRSYQPPDGSTTTWKEMEQRYRKSGFEIYNVGVCQTRTCKIHCRKDKTSTVMFLNSAVDPHPHPPGRENERPPVVHKAVAAVADEVIPRLVNDLNQLQHTADPHTAVASALANRNQNREQPQQQQQQQQPREQRQRQSRQQLQQQQQ